MTELPMFEDPLPQADAPKKPRRKPTRKARKAVVVPKPVKKRRKKRVVKAAKVNGTHAGGRFSSPVYQAIARLIAMTDEERKQTLELAKEIFR